MAKKAVEVQVVALEKGTTENLIEARPEEEAEKAIDQSKKIAHPMVRE